MCVKPRQRRKKKTFYTIGRFLHLLVRVWQTGKHLEKELETASRIFRFIVVLHLFWLWIWLDLIESESRCWRIIITYRGGREERNKRNENFFGRWDAQHTRRRRSNNINHEFVTRRQPYNGTHALWLYSCYTHTLKKKREIQIDKMEERERRRRTQPLSPIKVDPNSTTGDIRKWKYKREEGKKKKGVENR